MTRPVRSRRGGRSSTAPRVGLFGLLGSGNLGNDASFEVVLNYLRTDHPDAILDAMCMGPERIRAQYGIDAVALQSYRERADNASGAKAIVLKVLGKGIDALRTASWTRQHEVVIVPGMGVLETSLPLRATGVPYALFLLGVSGRLFATKVALVSVGATMVEQRPTRWLGNAAARLAFYRSYRDAPSLDAMRRRGVYSPGDRVCPDLVFGLPACAAGPGDPGVVGVGVMRYCGGNDDRELADDIYARYITAMKGFVRWLIDTGHRVRLFWGDDVDIVTVEEILTELRADLPDLDAACLRAEPCDSLRELMEKMAPVGTVVAIRYHNVMSALRLSKPTISIGYSTKHDALTADMGMSEFSLSAQSLDADKLIGQFTQLKERAPELRTTLREHSLKMMHDLDSQFSVLSSRLFSADKSRNVQYYKNDFWKQENTKYARPHYRLEKSARIINGIAGRRNCDLLDVGCGPATLAKLLRPNINYYGIDIAIQDPAPNLLEADILEAPIKFGEKHFDVVVAQGLFEYLGDHQSQKFSEIAQVLDDEGTFVTSYVNFGHRRCSEYWPYSNVQSIDAFRESLSTYFVIQRWFATSHNWRHNEPSRKYVKIPNMHLNVKAPLITSKLAVEYFFICSPRGG